MARPGIRGLGKARKRTAKQKKYQLKKLSNLAKLRVVVVGVSCPNVNIWIFYYNKIKVSDYLGLMTMTLAMLDIIHDEAANNCNQSPVELIP